MTNNLNEVWTATGASPAVVANSPIAERRDPPTTSTFEMEGLSRWKFVSLLIFVGLLAMLAAFMIGAFVPTARDANITSWKSNLFIEILIAIGTSIFSAMLFYSFYSRFLEKIVLRDVTTRAAEAAANYATNLYENRFNRMIPSHIYGATTSPRPDFESHLRGVLKQSHIYKFKGDDGGYTAFRIDRLCQTGHLLEKEITLLLLDPSEDYLLRERAKMELAESNPTFSKDDLTKHIEDMRKGIFATVVAMFDISHKIRGKVAFHKEHLFFRSEIFDDGIFLTYYLGGEFPSTCFYPKTTLTYHAYLENFRQNFKNATPTIAFTSRMEEAELKAYLVELKCDIEIDELREFKTVLFNSYEKMTS